MVNLETLKLIVTPTSIRETIICAIILNILTFLVIWAISSVIMVILTGGEPLDEVWKRDKKLKHIQFIILFGIMFALTLVYINESRKAYYTITVGIKTEEIQAQELHNIKEMEEFPEYLIREKIKDRENMELVSTYEYKATNKYFPRYTKLINENGNITFTTKICTGDYEKYETPEEFKKDIESLAKYTVEYTKDQIKKRPEVMKKFTEEHLTKQGK